MRANPRSGCAGSLLLALLACAAPEEPTTSLGQPPAATVQSSNLLADPGFESQGAGWRGVGLAGRTVVSTEFVSGSKSLEIRVSGQYGRAVYQDVAAAAGTTYDAAGWLKTSGVSGAGARIQVEWLSASALPEPPPAANLLRVDTVVHGTGGLPWGRHARTLVAPPGTAVARFRLVAGPDPDAAGAAWFDDLEIATATPPPPDTVSPSVVLTSPPDGATVSGVVPLSASASDDNAVAGVRFQVDGVDLGAEDQTAPYSTTWNTGVSGDGSHTLTAVARDQAGNTTVSAPVTVTVDNSNRFDVVVILTDDQRHDLMQYMPLTSALLQDETVRFARAFATTPNCCPSRASILTGLYSHNTGVLQNYGSNGGAPKFDPSSTVATWLQQAGYRTGLYGKYLNAYHKLAPAVPPGWSEFHAFVRHDDDAYYNYTLNDNGVLTTAGSAPHEYSTDVMAAAAVGFIESTPQGQPLFLYFAPFGPHNPATPGPGDAGAFAGFPPWRPPSFNEADVSDKPSWVRALPLLTAAEIDASDAFHQRQLETLQSVDRAVAAIVDALVRTGRWAKTLVVYASDNGLGWVEHRLKDRKSCAYEVCVRIPLWVRMPGVAARTDSNLVATIDIAPTIAELAGVVPPTKVNGLSLLPLVWSPSAPWRTELLLEELGSSSSKLNYQGVRTSRYLYNEYRNGERELYDLDTDPHQLQNVVNDPAYSSVVSSLRAVLRRLQQS